MEADRCELDFAVGPLLHKQAVIESGTVSGLRFGTPRDISGALPDARPTEVTRSIQWFNDETNQRTQEWLEHLNRRFDPKLINQFEAIKRTAALVDRLPRQMAALDERVRELRQRAEELQSKVNTALANPLRHVEFLKAVTQEVPALQRDFEKLADEVERLPELVDADRRAIVAARRQDEEWLREQLQIPPVDASALTAYLLRKQVAAPLDEVIGWLRFARQMVPAEQVSPAPARQRGEEIFFAGCERSPRFLVRSLALQGTARVGGQPVELRGTLSDFASTPALHERPMRLKLTTTGSLPLALQATIDRTGTVARDELLVDCHGIVLPEAELGELDQLRLALAPSVGALSISLVVDGDKLSGGIQLVQQQVQITPSVGGNLSGVPMTAALDDTLGDVGALATRISLSGTLDEPKCTLWSNLGPAVAEALDRALHRAADQHARRLLAESQQQVDQQLTQLERQLSEAQAELLPQLAQAAGQLDEVAAQQRPPRRISTKHLGRRLPANSLFR